MGTGTMEQLVAIVSIALFTASLQGRVLFNSAKVTENHHPDTIVKKQNDSAVLSCPGVENWNFCEFSHNNDTRCFLRKGDNSSHTQEHDNQRLSNCEQFLDSSYIQGNTSHCVLEFMHLQLHDKGNWSCFTAKNESLHWSAISYDEEAAKDFKLTIIAEPGSHYFDPQPNDGTHLYIKEGQPFSISCIVETVWPVPNITWSLQDQNIPQTVNITTTVNTYSENYAKVNQTLYWNQGGVELHGKILRYYLKIHSIDEDGNVEVAYQDYRELTIALENHTLSEQLETTLPPETNFYITEAAPQRFIRKPQMSNVTFTCVTNIPWESCMFRQNHTNKFCQVNKTSTARCNQMFNGVFNNYDETSCSLTIYGLQNVDNGAWKCVMIDSERKRAIAKFPMEVIVEPNLEEKIPNTIETFEGVSGTPTNFSCKTYKSRPAVLITWAINSQPIENGNMETVVRDEECSRNLCYFTTTSVLTLNLTSDLNNKELTCTLTILEIDELSNQKAAYNQTLEGWTLNIGSQPTYPTTAKLPNTTTTTTTTTNMTTSTTTTPETITTMTIIPDPTITTTTQKSTTTITPELTTAIITLEPASTTTTITTTPEPATPTTTTRVKSTTTTTTSEPTTTTTTQPTTSTTTTITKLTTINTTNTTTTTTEPTTTTTTTTTEPTTTTTTTSELTTITITEPTTTTTTTTTEPTTTTSTTEPTTRTTTTEPTTITTATTTEPTTTTTTTEPTTTTTTTITRTEPTTTTTKTATTTEPTTTTTTTTTTTEPTITTTTTTTKEPTTTTTTTEPTTTTTTTEPTTTTTTTEPTTTTTTTTTEPTTTTTTTEPTTTTTTTTTTTEPTTTTTTTTTEPTTTASTTEPTTTTPTTTTEITTTTTTTTTTTEQTTTTTTTELTTTTTIPDPIECNFNWTDSQGDLIYPLPEGPCLPEPLPTWSIQGKEKSPPIQLTIKDWNLSSCDDYIEIVTEKTWKICDPSCDTSCSSDQVVVIKSTEPKMTVTLHQLNTDNTNSFEGQYQFCVIC